jgi:hypothetical protein
MRTNRPKGVALRSPLWIDRYTAFGCIFSNSAVWLTVSGILLYLSGVKRGSISPTTERVHNNFAARNIQVGLTVLIVLIVLIDPRLSALSALLGRGNIIVSLPQPDSKG